MLPLVSIMIATYNQTDYIVEAVNSALNQDYQNLEIIVSDDSNNDETYYLLKEKIEKNKIKYYKNKLNLGRVGNYRNLLYSLSSGKYVIMLDGDDFFVDNSFISSSLKFFFEDSQIVAVASGINEFDENNFSVIEKKITENDFVFDGKSIFDVPQFVAYHQSTVYDREIACKLDFYRHCSVGSDSESLFRLYTMGKVAYRSNISTTWRIHKLNATFTRDIKTQIKELDFIDSIYQSVKEKVSSTKLDKWRKYMYCTMTNHLLKIAFESKHKKNYIFVFIKLFKFSNKQKCIKEIYILISEWFKKNEIQVNSFEVFKKHIQLSNSTVLKSNSNIRFDDKENLDLRKYLIIGKKGIITANFIFETNKGEIVIGDNVHIGGATFISRHKITVKNDVTMAWGITIYDHNSHSIYWDERKNDNSQCYQDYIYNRSYNLRNKDWSNVISKEIIIESKVWIGFDVVILKGVKIGEGAVVGARSVVTKDVPPWTVVAGNPAIVVKQLPH